MDLVLLASVVTVVAFVYMLIFGQRGLVDWLERRRQAASSRSPEERTRGASSSKHPTNPLQSANKSRPPISDETLPPQVITDIQAKLTEGVLTVGDDVARALPYMALARRGINRDLLCQLTGWSQERGEQVLEDLQRCPFVKTREGLDRFFLTDEMYDLLNRKIWDQRDVERKGLYAIILDYYDRKITQAKDRQRQDLLVEQLYYQLVADPRKGYAEYCRLSDGALYEQDVSFDMRLRDEVLRFCAECPESHTLTKEFVDYDNAVRWVKRHRFAREYEKAIRAAEAVTNNMTAGQTGDADFRLARADLDVNHAMVLIYSGRIEPGVAMLRVVISELEGKLQSDTPAREDMADYFCAWRRNLVLGLAHNNLGYTYWTGFGRYRAALEEFRLALPYFLTAKLEEEMATTSDNMGRVYAQLADRTRAELLVRDGLELRRQLGREIRIGLSLNSQILLRLSFGDPHGARRLSEQRLQTFVRLGAQREIGAASINLGHSLRQLGTLRKVHIYRDEECDEFLRAAAGHLKKAIEIFSPHAIDEPIRLIEAYNELGCVYREQATLADARDPARLLSPAAEMAIKNLQEAIARAQEKKYWVQFVDSYEDLAQVYFQVRHYSKVEECLDKAEEAVPDVYKVKEVAGLQEIPPEDCCEEFWRQMGKIELQRGHLTFDREQSNSEGASRSLLNQAMQHYALAAGYIERYSGQTRFQISVEQLYDHFKHHSRADLEYAQNELLPAIAAQYRLDLNCLHEFFKDTLGLALQLAR